MEPQQPKSTIAELEAKAKQIDAVLEHDLQNLPNETKFRIAQSYQDAIKIAREIGRLEGSSGHT